MKFENKLYRYVHSLQGDIVGILDTNGTRVVEYKYDAWGKPVSVDGTLKTTLGALNPFRYRGYVWDEESELFYLRNRYYSPKVGRIVNADTQLGGHALFSANLYLYCLNNPTLYSDSDGCEPQIAPTPSRPEDWKDNGKGGKTLDSKSTRPSPKNAQKPTKSTDGNGISIDVKAGNIGKTIIFVFLAGAYLLSGGILPTPTYA